MKVQDIVAVPHDRLGALIGENGKTKKEIEEITNTKISVDSETGQVKITREVNEKQGASIYTRELVSAISLGFTPRKAFKVLDPEIYLETIDLKDHIKESQLSRVKARIIGRDGRARTKLSVLSKTDIVIYKNKINILGGAENVDAAKSAIMMLIEGATHKSVFKHLEKRRIK